ncbi:methyltransferase domain-containing protein, partial [Salmonella enterica subsp. enterica serovar Montevideo]|nr:methyltransferase domain-containing protein [Salmonella enterica subsp. enterica serovar Montevideo]
HANVLDMGCGAGHASFVAAQHANSVVAYDLSASMLEVVAGAAAMASHLRKISGVLGLLEQEPDVFLQSGAQADDGEVAEIEALI